MNQGHGLDIAKGGVANLLGSVGAAVVIGIGGYLVGHVWDEWPTAFRVSSVVVLVVGIGIAILVGFKVVRRGRALILASVLIGCLLIGVVIGTAFTAPRPNTPTSGQSSGPTSPPTNRSPSPNYTYVEQLILSPSPTGQGQAYMNSKAYEHSVWYDARTTLSFDIPVAGKYQFLDVYVGQQDGITAAANYDVKGDSETLVGMHGLGGGDKPEHLTIPITGRQVVTFDVVVYYGNAQTCRIVLGSARLLT
jgi:NPCBM/NEW2 domain